jgi:hypothetical protein
LPLSYHLRFKVCYYVKTHHFVLNVIQNICEETLLVWEDSKLLSTKKNDHPKIIKHVEDQITKAPLLIQIALLVFFLPFDYIKICRKTWLLSRPIFILRPILTYLFCLLIMAAAEQESLNARI